MLEILGFLMFDTHLVCLIRYLLAVEHEVGCYARRNYLSRICFVSLGSLIANLGTACR